MNKKNIAYIRRRIALLASTVSAAAFALGLILFGIAGVPVSSTVTKESCGIVSEIGYDLAFVENPVYNENLIEFGDAYVAKYIEAVTLDFMYTFDCAGASDIRGTYSVSALLEGIYNSTDLIWKKEYPLVPETDFASGQVDDSLTLPIGEYEKVASDVETNTGVTTTAKMTVTFTVNTTATVGGTPVTDTSVTTLAFDLSEDVLVMGGEPRQEKTTPVEETLTRELIPKRTALFVFAPLVLLAAGAFAWMLLCTRGVREDPVKLELGRLYKRYGSRIAELNPGIKINRHEPIMVRSFKDLLLTADELKKPIFKNNADNCVDVEFYVIDDIEVYVFSAVSLREESGLCRESNESNA